MKKLFTTTAVAATLALGLAVAPAQADEIERVEAQGDVAATMDALVAAVEGAGATVFARVDHAKGAADVGMELRPSQVLIFGNPKIGTPPMQEDMRAGLYLPLKVLVYEDAEGKTWLAYEEPEEMFDDLDVDDDSEALEQMEDALEKLVGKAAGKS